jgi:hypothetical protein
MVGSGEPLVLAMRLRLSIHSRHADAAPLVLLAGVRAGNGSFPLSCVRISTWLEVFCHENLIEVVTILLLGLLLDSIFQEAHPLI